MTMVVGSLRQRLTIWWLVIMAILSTLLLIEAWSSAHRAADRSLDGQLKAASLTIAESIQWIDGQPTFKIPPSALQILATSWQERVFYLIESADGNIITKNADIPISHSLRNDAETTLVFTNSTIQGQPIRLHGRQINSSGWDTHAPIQIWVAHTRYGRDQLALQLFEGTLTRLIVMIIIAGALVIVIMRTLLTPLRQLRHQLRERTSQDMQPLTLPVPRELGELVETLNTLLLHQRQHRDILLRFIADASHQLRTPLAGLQSISELALSGNDPESWRRALHDVHDSAERTSRLATQLLNLARLDHAMYAHNFQVLNLDSIMHDSALDWAEKPRAYKHDLGLEIRSTGPFTIKGEAWAIHELLNNLIDNALRYTPDGSKITLALKREENDVVLSVEDNGPGVEEPRLTRLLQPFERAGRQDTMGSGLGLAIVDSIAKRHDAALHITPREPHGVCVTLHFPAHLETPGC